MEEGTVWLTLPLRERMAPRGIADSPHARRRHLLLSASLPSHSRTRATNWLLLDTRRQRPGRCWLPQWTATFAHSRLRQPPPPSPTSRATSVRRAAQPGPHQPSLTTRQCSITGQQLTSPSPWAPPPCSTTPGSPREDSWLRKPHLLLLLSRSAQTRVQRSSAVTRRLQPAAETRCRAPKTMRTPVPHTRVGIIQVLHHQLPTTTLGR